MLAKLAEVGEPTVVYGPPEVAARSTTYPVAPLTALHDRSISDGDTAVATTPAGDASNVVADTSLDRAEVNDGAVAFTT